MRIPKIEELPLSENLDVLEDVYRKLEEEYELIEQQRSEVYRQMNAIPRRRVLMHKNCGGTVEHVETVYEKPCELCIERKKYEVYRCTKCSKVWRLPYGEVCYDNPFGIVSKEECETKLLDSEFLKEVEWAEVPEDPQRFEELKKRYEELSERLSEIVEKLFRYEVAIAIKKLEQRGITVKCRCEGSRCYAEFSDGTVYFLGNIETPPYFVTWSRTFEEMPDAERIYRMVAKAACR